MDVIKTILKLSFFLLGCVMAALTLLVIPVGFKSVLFFLIFSIIFYLLSFSYTKNVIKYIFSKFKNIKLSKIKKLNIKIPKISAKKKLKDCYIKLNKNIVYNEAKSIIKLNTKEYNLDQLYSADLILNSNKITIKELKKSKNIKKLEIKVGIKVKKITYRNFKYIAKKADLINKKEIVKQAICDYKELNKLLKQKIDTL